MGTKAALITGSARRIGRAIATHLAGEGWDIAVHYNTSREEALSLQAEVRGRRGRLPALCRRPERSGRRRPPGRGAASAISRTRACSSTAPRSSRRDTVATLNPELWDEHLRINALSPILLTRAFHRLGRGQNCVINMLDQKVANATPDFFSYTISKLALHNATRMLAMSLWPKTRVNGIAPGLVLQERRPDRGAVPAGAQAARRWASARRSRRSAARSRCSRVPRRSRARSSPSTAGGTCRSSIPSRTCRRSEPMGASIMPPPGQRCIVIDDLRLDALHRRARAREAGAPGGVDHDPHVRARVAATPRSDDLADHVSYADVVAKLKERAKSARHINLVETLAEEVGRLRARRRARGERGGRRAQDRRSCRRPRASASSSAGSAAAEVSRCAADVSVIMPAYRAAATIVRAVQSVFAQKGVAVELVLCADDDLDYAALLPADLRCRRQG